jgi:hypothetical protein
VVHLRRHAVLLPVRITGGLAFTSYSMKLDGDETAQPNLVLLEWLKSTRGLDLDELAHPLLDDSGIAIGAVFAAIRKRLVEAELPYRLDESASLAILRFSTFQIWKDLDAHWSQLMQSPVVEHLVNRPGETFTDPAGSRALAVSASALAHSTGDSATRAKALTVGGIGSFHLGEYRRALDELQAATALYATLDDAREQGICLTWQGNGHAVLLD